MSQQGVNKQRRINNFLLYLSTEWEWIYTLCQHLQHRYLNDLYVMMWRSSCQAEQQKNISICRCLKSALDGAGDVWCGPEPHCSMGRPRITGTAVGVHHSDFPHRAPVYLKSHSEIALIGLQYSGDIKTTYGRKKKPGGLGGLVWEPNPPEIYLCARFLLFCPSNSGVMIPKRMCAQVVSNL